MASSAKVPIFPLYLMRHERDRGPKFETPVDVRSDNNTRNEVLTRKSGQVENSRDSGVVQGKQDAQSLIWDSRKPPEYF